MIFEGVSNYRYALLLQMEDKYTTAAMEGKNMMHLLYSGFYHRAIPWELVME